MLTFRNDKGEIEGVKYNQLSAAFVNDDAGQVAGNAETSGLPHAFFYTDGVMRDLGTFGGPESHANAMDCAGHVVGHAEFPGRWAHAFIYGDGTLLDLNDFIPPDSGWELLTAFAINDVGQILGTGLKDGRRTPYLYQDGQVVAQPGAGWINNSGDLCPSLHMQTRQ